MVVHAGGAPLWWGVLRQRDHAITSIYSSKLARARFILTITVRCSTEQCQRGWLVTSRHKGVTRQGHVVLAGLHVNTPLFRSEGAASAARGKKRDGVVPDRSQTGAARIGGHASDRGIGNLWGATRKRGRL